MPKAIVKGKPYGMVRIQFGGVDRKARPLIRMEVEPAWVNPIIGQRAGKFLGTRDKIQGAGKSGSSPQTRGRT